MLPASKGFMSSVSCCWISKSSKDRVPTCLCPVSCSTLTGTDPIPVCSRFPCHSCSLLPFQSPWVSTCSTSSFRESKATPQLCSVPSLGSAVPLPLPCTEDLRQDAVVCTETLVLCKQEQKDYLYFNPISNEPTNICQICWAVKAPSFPAEVSEQELEKLELTSAEEALVELSLPFQTFCRTWLKEEAASKIFNKYSVYDCHKMLNKGKARKK